MDGLGANMGIVVMSLMVATNLNGAVTQSVRSGGCLVESGIFSCRETDIADISASIRPTDVNTIDVIDIFNCNMSWISEEVFAGIFSSTREVK